MMPIKSLKKEHAFSAIASSIITAIFLIVAQNLSCQDQSYPLTNSEPEVSYQAPTPTRDERIELLLKEVIMKYGLRANLKEIRREKMRFDEKRKECPLFQFVLIENTSKTDRLAYSLQKNQICELVYNILSVFFETENCVSVRIDRNKDVGRILVDKSFWEQFNKSTKESDSVARAISFIKYSEKNRRNECNLMKLWD
jgi:hypothetical protein